MYFKLSHTSNIYCLTYIFKICIIHNIHIGFQIGLSWQCKFVEMYIKGENMKKKILGFIFALCLIIPCAIILGACGTKGKEPEATVHTLTIITDKGTHKCEFTDKDASIASILSDNDIDIDYDNSIGFYWDAEFTSWQPATTSVTSGDKTLYTKMATLDKINVNAGVVTAKSSTITGEVVVPFNATSLQIQDCDMSSLILCHNIDIVSAQGLSTCDLLTDIKVVENRESGTFYSMNGVLFEYNNYDNISRLVKYPNKKLGTTYIVPKTNEDSHYITHIGEYAFTNCTNIKSVDVNGLYVNARAFYDCDSLETVTGINSGSKSVDYVGDLAFANCDNLTEVSLSALSGSANAFDNCLKLERITAESNVANIWFSCSGCTSLKEIILDSYRVLSCKTTTAPVIYVKSSSLSGGDSELCTDFTDNYTKQETSDKTGYDKYVRNAG